MGTNLGTIRALYEGAQTLQASPPSKLHFAELGVASKAPQEPPKGSQPGKPSFRGVLREDYFLILEAQEVTVVTAHYLLPPDCKEKVISYPQTARLSLPLLGALPEDYFLYSCNIV